MDRDPRSMILSRRARFVAAALAAAGIAASGQKGEAATDAGAADASASAPAAPLPPPTPAEIAEARALVEQARGLRAAGDHAGALARLRNAYALNRNARMLVPIAEECVAIDDFVGAIDAYEKLAAASDAPSAPTRDAIDRRLAELSAKIATVRITSTADGTTVILDDVKAGVTPLAGPLRMNPGQHRLRFQQADRVPLDRAVTVASGELLSLTIDMSAAAPYPCLEPPYVCLSIVERPHSCACDIVGGSK